jgi:hypothetical protein
MKRVPANPDRLLLDEIRGLIEQARLHVAQTANSTLTMLHWKLGERILREVLQGQRAQYGEEILPTLSAKLVPDYGQGFSARNLARMVKFAEAFTDENIVVSLSRELSWSHFVEILPLKKPLEREFYAEMCRIERWSVRTLRERIGGQLYLRTALTKQPEALVDAELEKAPRRRPDDARSWCSATPTCWTFSACPMATASAIWKRRSCATWNAFCWNWAQASVLLPGRSASVWAPTTFISICCSTTGTCAGWWPWN